MPSPSVFSTYLHHSAISVRSRRNSWQHEGTMNGPLLDKRISEVPMKCYTTSNVSMAVIIDRLSLGYPDINSKLVRI